MDKELPLVINFWHLDVLNNVISWSTQVATKAHCAGEQQLLNWVSNGVNCLVTQWVVSTSQYKQWVHPAADRCTDARQMPQKNAI